MWNSILLASNAKGRLAFLKRVRRIVERYGMRPDRMDKALKQFTGILGQYDCGATFPITAVTLQRSPHLITKYLSKNLEFAVHGYTHINYAQLAPEIQLAHLKHALKVFTEVGIPVTGFRSPYLSRNDHLYASVEAAGFSYISNQPMIWDALKIDTLSPSAAAGFERAMSFYNPWLASERSSLPFQESRLVEIPITLPDDEILIDRLDGGNDLVKDAWLRILSLTYQRGELFTLQLHPERIAMCADGLSAVLARARSLKPGVWCTRLDEIATWWKTRAEARLEISGDFDCGFFCDLNGPYGLTVLARGIETDAPSLAWENGYREVKTTHFAFKSSLRPLIGLSPSSSTYMVQFFNRHGYFIETSLEPERYAFYFDQATFDANQEQSILNQIEGSAQPLLRLGLWPNGNKSALAITGDIDALTLWDYGLRIIGM